MLRFLFYSLIWRIGNYILRNPHARKAVGQACLALLLLWVSITLLSVIGSALGVAAAGFNDWMATTPNSAIILTGISLAVLAGITTFAIVARPAWREWLSRYRYTLKSRLGRADATTPESLEAGSIPVLPSTDDLDKIRLLDRAESPGAALAGFGETIESDDDLLDQIVIYGEE